MTDKQLKQLKELLEAEGVKGKTHLEKFIWLNESQPKYNIGDTVVFDSLGCYCYGNRVRNFIGNIVRCMPMASLKSYQYEVECFVEVDGQIYKHTFMTGDEDITIKCDSEKMRVDLLNRLVRKGRYAHRIEPTRIDL